MSGDQAEFPFGGLPPFVKGSDTSLTAALSQRQSATGMRGRVLAYLRQVGEYGATDNEIETVFDLLHQTASARRRELVLQDLAYDSGRRRKTRSGRSAAVWVARVSG